MILDRASGVRLDKIEAGRYGLVVCGGGLRLRWSLFLLLIGLVGCSGPNAGSRLPHGDAAYRALPIAQSGPGGVADQNYKIGPLDSLDVTVFEEPDLSVKAVQVDASGNISLALIGTVKAQGQTAAELSKLLADRYGTKYLEHPQVTVSVASSASQKVVVQGEVTEPGVYDIKGTTTLLEAISLAKGETRVAAVKDVAVFRTINGQRMGAVFDIGSIRRGETKDPVILGNDLIVVGFSRSRGFWRDVLSAAPLLNVFSPVRW